jgi:hypothetical protein
MKAESWKKIIDDLDDDIVDSAAERLSKPEHSTVDDMEAFTHDGKPTEYKYPSERKKHRGLYIGIGSAAAAAAVAGFVLLNNSGLVMSPNPVLTAESSSAETYATTPFVAYVEKSAPDTQSELVSIQTDGIDFILFDEYFYDVWEMTDDESGEVVDIQLGYGDTTIFGEHGYTYDCLGTILTGEGCYMIAAGEGQYDLWFVPENDRNSLIVYCDAQIEDGQVVYEDSMIKCADTVIFSGYGTEKLEEDGSLGYFGQEKLAQKMGLTTEYLFEEPAMSESTSVYPEDGSTAKNWVRTYELRGTNIRLVSQSSDKVVVTELMEDSNSGAGEWFDITWTYSGGEWLTTGYAVSEIMPFSDTYEYLDKNKFQTFEDMFAGTWQENSTGAELTMDYTEDPFEPGDHIFIYYIYHGMALFCVGAQGNTAYYIPDDEPDVMYQYAATEKSGNVVKRSEYTNVYTRRDGEFTPIDEAAGSRLGVIGFKKYLNTYSELGDVMNDLILEKYDSIWSHAFYMPGVSSFGGYTVIQTGDGSYIFTYQEYNRDTGADRWVTYTITNTIKGWFTERAVADSGNFSIELEVPDGGQSDS